MSDRQLYNNLRSIINRSVLDMKSTSSVLSSDSDPSSNDWFGCKRQIDSQRNTDSWWDASSNELRFASVEFMSLANEIHNLLALNQQSVNNKSEATINQTRPKLEIEVLDLEAAVRLFGCFVCDPDAKLQSMCCAFLFHHGSTSTKSSWWPDFFPAVIKKYFSSSSSDSLESIFILLAFICDQSVRHHELQTPIIEKLLLYLQELVNTPKTVNGKY